MTQYHLFDGNKKYAIIHKLFQEIPSFKGKTVLLFTHEFSTIIDTIYVMEKDKSRCQVFRESREVI